jgi:putative acetyltransferase
MEVIPVSNSPLMRTPTLTSLEHVHIRSYREDDAATVRRLYEDGRLTGQVAPNDTAADIDNIHEAYLSQERCHFWVAEAEGRVVGMIGVAEEEPHLAEIRRLRVDPAYRAQPQDGDATHLLGLEHRLMEAALAFCRHHGYLKVVLDTAFEEGPAKQEFEKFAFQHNRTRTIQGKDLLEFYLDLYHQPKSEEKA